MKANLLLVSGRGKADDLARTIERNGYFCFQARGPLKMRTLLSQQPVDLIVWWESPDNTGLDEDLAGVWRQFAKFPVVALLEGSAAVAPALRAHAYAAVIPGSDAEALLQALNVRFSDSASIGGPPTETQGELAVRKVLSAGDAPTPPAGDAGLIQATGTSISAEERALLREQSPDSGKKASSTWLRRLFGQDRAQ